MMSMFLTTGEAENSVVYYPSWWGWVGYCEPVAVGNELLSVTVKLAEEHNFTIGGSSNSFDIKSIVLHELGHALGVAHCHEDGDPDPCWSPTCNDNVMYRLFDHGEVRTTFQPYDTASYISIYW